MSKNPRYYSHKFKKPGLNYEIGISIYENKVVWCRGPNTAQQNDFAVYEEELRSKIPITRVIIGDKGYRGDADRISTPNPRAESLELRKFKGRVRARHESFNSRLKNFRALDSRFRHGIEAHKDVFEAILVICQIQLENGFPLFDA